MKTKSFISKLFFIVLSVAIFAACGPKNPPAPTPTPGGTTVEPTGEQILFKDGKEIGNGEQEFKIKEKHTLKKGTYVLKGWVYIEEGAELTIEPGTIIKGDKDTKAAIVVKRGGKIFAQGTKDAPIVFTSNQPAGQRKPGDWGGIIVCGKANNNSGKEMMIEGGPDAHHGGNDDNDNSGVLSYIRCEFAGYPLKPDQEINGITFGSVGRGTKVDHLQVSYCNDDSFEWFGGSVNATHLIAYHGWDDDFDTDTGFSGKLQFLLSVRHPRMADTSVSNGFESDNNSAGSDLQPFTSCVFSNVTLVGPLAQAKDFENKDSYINGGDMNPNNGSKLGQFQAAMQVRRNSRLSCFNSVAVGFPVGLIIENDKISTTQTWATEGKLKLQNIHFAGMEMLGSDKNKSFKNHPFIKTEEYEVEVNGKKEKRKRDIFDETKESFSAGFFTNTGNNNKVHASVEDLKFKQLNSLLPNPNWGPMAGSPLLTGASFADALLQSGFEKVDYIGAFKSDSEADDWTKGWANFDPQNTKY